MLGRRIEPLRTLGHDIVTGERYEATKTIALALLFAAGPTAGAGPEADPVSRLRFALSFPAERSGSPLDGRLLLLISADDADEPRFQINDGPDTQQVFGTDVVGLAPGAPSVIGRREQ